MEYRLTGHLGNTTVLFRDADEDGQIAAEGSGPGAGEVMQRLWHYPFGLRLQGIGRDEPAPAHLYRYNGKAWDPASGLSDYGARWYDAGSGRWSGVDPLAGDYASWSPYNYVMGNPISFIDPDGRSVESTHTDANGNIIAVYDDGDLGVYKHNDKTTKAEVDASYSADNTSAEVVENIWERHFILFRLRTLVLLKEDKLYQEDK